MDLMTPVCPICHKPMKKKQSLGFWECIEVVIENICLAGCAPTQYACKSKVPNPKYKTWEVLKKQYDKDMQAYIKEQSSIMGKLGIRRPTPPKPIPPMPPKKIPCKNHYNQQVSGEYNEKISPKKKLLFLSDGMGHPLPLKKII